MSRIRSKNTSLEKRVFAFLRSNNIYFQKHYGKAPGKPDVAIPRKKKAVFIDGDFWHGRHWARTKSHLPNGYWREKIEENARRDRKIRRRLKKEGWEVLRVWEGDIKRKRTKDKAFGKILSFLA